MKWPFVSRKKYEWLLASEQEWRRRSKFLLTIPYLKLDGDIGEVQIYGDPEQIEKIQETLNRRIK